MTELLLHTINPENLNVTLAYLDPGTGSVLLSVIIAILSSLYYVFRNVYYKIIPLLFERSAQGERDLRRRYSLVLYSEGSQYSDLFIPLLRELESRKQPCLFLSGSQTDLCFSLKSKIIDVQYIGRNHAAWTHLCNLKADMCVMTTPGLDVLQIKRSKHVKHYAHIIHSPTDKSFNRPYSFDYYDSVFISGEHQRKTFRTLESIRRLPEKSLYLTGCIYYDELKRKKDNGGGKTISAKGAEVTILVAPTWGKNGLLQRYGMRVIKPLIDARYHVIIRPHPQTWISEPDLLLPYQALANKLPSFTIDDQNSPMESMQSANVLISDISGIIFDYAFLFERPVITVETEVDKRGFEAQDLPFEPWELTILDHVGRTISEGDIDDIPQIVKSMSAEAGLKKKIRVLRDECVVNFGCAASPTVETIQKILVELNT